MPVQINGALRKLALSAFAVGATATSSACVTVHDHGYHAGGDYAYPYDEYGYGYPGDPPLIFHSGFGLYVVDGYPDHYFHEGYFYRWHSGYWNRSRYWGHDWERCDARYLPRPIHHVSDNYYARRHRPHQGWDRGTVSHLDRAEDHGDRHDRRDHRGRVSSERDRSEHYVRPRSRRQPDYGRPDRGAHGSHSGEPRGVDRGHPRREHELDRDRSREHRAEPTRLRHREEHQRPERRVAEREVPRARESRSAEPNATEQPRQHGRQHRGDESGKREHGHGTPDQTPDSTSVSDQPGNGRSHRDRAER